MSTSPGTPAPAAAPAAPAPPPPAPAPPTDGKPAAGALSGLFDEGSAGAPGASAAPAEAAAPVAAGPPWPVPIPAAVCKAAALQFLKDKTVPPETPPPAAASAKKVAGMLGSAERHTIEKFGAESHLADALAARIALDSATSDGVRLYSSHPAASVDAVAVAALTRQADEAAARLQKEANAAVGKGEVESLQMITAASAALSRDLLNFKETADRLRGLGAAPRLGGGALDPDLILPGQAPRQKTATSTAPAPVRAELRDFQGLEAGQGRGKQVLMFLAVVAFVAALANALYFGMPHHTLLTAEIAGKGIERIDISGQSALVTVTPAWFAFGESAIPPLAAALREAGVKKAILITPNGTPGGVLDVMTGKVTGLAKPKPPPPPK
jgi:hypothetical protein